MADYVISTDTSCDFPPEYVQEHQLPLVTLFYSIDGVSGSNGCPNAEELKNFYDKMRAGAQTKTQQASIEDTEQVFREVAQQGKDLLHIAFSSGLSGTANAARLAAENIMEEFPDRKIVVIDSLCASLGQGLLVDYVRDAGACAIVKGLRAVSDFEYEFQMALMNKELYDRVETVFLTTSTANQYLSSSVVKQIASFGGNIRPFVPEQIHERVAARLNPSHRNAE